MGRPAGSKNKPKIVGNGLLFSKFDKQIENAPIIKNSGMGWVSYGSRNLYPFDLINLYNTSVTHKACIDFAVNAIVGDGIDWEQMKLTSADMPAPNYYTSWNQFIKALAFDFCLYSAFAFQIIRNKDGKTYSFFNQPIETVRLEEMDEDGVVNGVYLCKDWSAYGKYPPVYIKTFGFQSEKEIPMGEPYLFYYRQPNPVNAYYGLPVYSSALNAIQAEAQFQNYELKSITNGFTPTGALTLPAVETDDERQAILKNIQALFTGAENSNALMVLFRNNIEEKPIEYTSFAPATANVNLYEAANERTIHRIMAAHKITSKALIGYPADDTGFSNSGEYLEAAFSLYNITVANNNRREILDCINNLFRMNGVDVEIVLKPLRYATDTTQTQINDNPETQDADTVDESEAVEREDNTI